MSGRAPGPQQRQRQWTHGHLIPRPDRTVTRCGGPRMCRVCADEQAMVQAALDADTTATAEVGSEGGEGRADGAGPGDPAPTPRPAAHDGRGECEPCQETLAAVHVATLRALEIAGKRLVTRNRHRRGETRHTPPHLRHTLTIVPVTEDELDRLLSDVWGLLPEALPSRGDVPAIVRAADTYVRQLLLAGEPHRMEYLAAAFDTAGIPR